MRQLRDLSARWAEYYAGVYRVPIELVAAIIDEESGWNPYAVSSKGAAGIMQLMPGTAVRFGVRNRFRIDQNIHGGVAYLQESVLWRSPSASAHLPRRNSFKNTTDRFESVRILGGVYAGFLFEVACCGFIRSWFLFDPGIWPVRQFRFDYWCRH
jgi:hypothetical protein